jgi:RNA polymerase sigma factor (sigma-70 family)
VPRGVVLDVSLPPFEHVIREHVGDLHRYLVAGVGPDDADDCLQEVLVAALRAYPELRPDSNVRGWLFTIAYRKAIDVHRANTRRRALAETVAGRADAVQPASEPPTPADDSLWDAVRRLPPQQRAAVLHRFLHDLPYREVGEIIGCSEAAARQNVRAALQHLREEQEP